MAGLKFILYLVILIQVFFSANNHLPTWFWLQEVSINLGAYWMLAHVATLAVLLLVWRRINRRFAFVSMLLLFGFSGSYLYQLRSFLFFEAPSAVRPPGSHTLKVLLVSAYQARTADVARLIDSSAPDVLGMLGVKSSTVAEFRLAERFPYSRSEPREDEFGIALYSRYPLAVDTKTSIGDLLPPIVSTTLKLDDQLSLQVLLIHAPSPFNRASFHDNKLLVRRTSTPLRQTSGPLLVFGNFNATEFSGSYKRFRNAGELLNAMSGYGYLRTWDVGSEFLRLSLDHIMYRDLEVKNFQRLASVGSDHFPILVEFAW